MSAMLPKDIIFDEPARPAGAEKRPYDSLDEAGRIPNKKPRQKDEASEVSCNETSPFFPIVIDDKADDADDEGEDKDDYNDGRAEEPLPHTTALPLPKLEKAVYELQRESEHLSSKAVFYSKILPVRKHLGEEVWKQWLKWLDENGGDLPWYIALPFNNVYSKHVGGIDTEDEIELKNLEMAWDGWEKWIWGSSAEDKLPWLILHNFRSAYAKLP